MIKNILISIILMATLLGGSGGQLTDDAYSTWSMNPYAWDGKPLPALGLQVTPAELQQNTVLIAAASNQPMVFNLPVSIDWRKYNGSDWTTSIRDQAGCGACVAFAVCGLMESISDITAKDPKLNKDLSEAYLFPRGGGSCGTGAQFERMLTAAKSGTTDEKCCPYTGDWSPCTDYKNRLTKITGWSTIYNVQQAKQYLATVGPLISGMNVPYDFFYYDGGIYQDNSGDSVGGHAIQVVGYNDAQQYWICKNSWGTSWGESGWFRIAYGDCGLGVSYPFYSVSMSGTPGPVPPGPVPVVDSPDINPWVSGDFTITLTSKLAKAPNATLVINGKNFTYTGLMAINKPIKLGHYNKGETIQFDIYGKKHTTSAWTSGWKQWAVRVDSANYVFKIREV